mmetsp:Transcript_51333/g.116705  ORF Transcript_51333/g.116705 Transcript_51333/m.116705 type:complete len:233 (-) Transcript_51333:1169-1867(-)
MVTWYSLRCQQSISSPSTSSTTASHSCQLIQSPKLRSSVAVSQMKESRPQRKRHASVICSSRSTKPPSTSASRKYPSVRRTSDAVWIALFARTRWCFADSLPAPFPPPPLRSRDEFRSCFWDVILGWPARLPSRMAEMSETVYAASWSPRSGTTRRVKPHDPAPPSHTWSAAPCHSLRTTPSKPASSRSVDAITGFASYSASCSLWSERVRKVFSSRAAIAAGSRCKSAWSR